MFSDLPKPPPADGEDAMRAGAQNREDDCGDREQQEPANLAAAFELFGSFVIRIAACVQMAIRAEQHGELYLGGSNPLGQTNPTSSHRRNYS